VYLKHYLEIRREGSGKKEIIGKRAIEVITEE
jgi:hypothetical protein